jgi:hypothetical protein
VDHQVGGCGFSGRGFHTGGCFLLGLPSTRLRDNCGFGLKLLRPGRLPSGGHIRLLGRLHDRLKRGIWIRGEVAEALATRTLGRRKNHPSPRSMCSAKGPYPLGFRSGRVACGGAFGQDRTHSLQKLTSLLSTSHRSTSSPCGFPHRHSTGAVPAR